jgi:hypothetical protein
MPWHALSIGRRARSTGSTGSTSSPQASSPQASSGHACRTNDAKARWLALGLIVAIALVHAWIISAGRFTHWPTRTAYYSLLADGFLKGKASLPIEPDPRLLASPDPYDPRFNSTLRLQDAALYRGKYYVYWGPLPALFLVPVRLLARGTEPIGDQYVFFAFALALVAISAKLILRARRRFFPEAPWWTIGFGVVIAGLVNPIPFLLANASIYQTAIVGGQVFLLTGIYAAWRALDTDGFPVGPASWPDVPKTMVRSADPTKVEPGAAALVGSALRTIRSRVHGTVRSARPAKLLMSRVKVTQRRPSAPAGAGNGDVRIHGLRVERLRRRAAPPVAIVRRPAGARTDRRCTDPAPEGREECSHGCSAESPTGDPERNPWKGEPCVPAPAGAEETFERLNENPTSCRPSTTCVSGVGNDKRCFGAGQVSGSSGAPLPEELPTTGVAGGNAGIRRYRALRSDAKVLPWLFVAGACWAMAIGCRISLTPAVVALSCLLAWRLWVDASHFWEVGRNLICLALPLLTGAGLFAAYNQARFGSPLEFGARYVLAGQNMHAMVAAGTFASARYVPVNLVRYLLEAPVLQRRFPFICPYGTAAWGWFGISVHKDFIMDSVAGMVWAAPVLGLAAVPVWVGLQGACRRIARCDDALRRATPLHDHPTPLPLAFWWLVTALLISSAVGFLPSLTVAASTMRYLADATPSLAILASFGTWMQLQAATPRHRAARICGLIILTAYSALTGVLLGVAGHYGRFVTDNFVGGR